MIRYGPGRWENDLEVLEDEMTSPRDPRSAPIAQVRSFGFCCEEGILFMHPIHIRSMHASRDMNATAYVRWAHIS